MEKFLNFLEALKTEENSVLIESIGKGYITCLESELAATLGIRRISEHEAMAKKDMHPELPPDYFMNGFVVIDPKDNPIAFTPSIKDAEFIKQNLESKAKRALDVSLPPMPPGVMLQDEKESNLPPEMKRSEDPTAIPKFLMYKENWDRYNDNLREILGEREKFRKKYPFFFD